MFCIRGGLVLGGRDYRAYNITRVYIYISHHIISIHIIVLIHTISLLGASAIRSHPMGFCLEQSREPRRSPGQEGGTKGDGSPTTNGDLIVI